MFFFSEYLGDFVEKLICLTANPFFLFQMPTGIIRKTDFSTVAIKYTTPKNYILSKFHATLYLKIVDYAFRMLGLPSHGCSYNSLRDELLFFYSARDNLTCVSCIP